MLFLSTLSLRRATHAAVLRRGPRHDFYPRSPCGERLDSMPQTATALKFLSTLSLRRATSCGNSETQSDPVFLSTLSLRRATGPTFIIYSIIDISIHALLAESDFF